MKLALIGVGSVIALRMALYLWDRPPEGMEFMLVHFLAITTIVFFIGKGELDRDLTTGFPDLMREGFKGAAVYAVLYGLFILAYYTAVEPDHFAQRLNALVERGVAQGQPESVIRPRMERLFTPFNYTSMTFFVLLVVGGFNALVIGLLHHKVLRRLRR